MAKPYAGQIVMTLPADDPEVQKLVEAVESREVVTLKARSGTVLSAGVRKVAGSTRGDTASIIIDLVPEAD